MWSGLGAYHGKCVLQGGGSAVLTSLTIVSPCFAGSPGPGDSHLCIEDVSDEIVEVDDVDWESSPPRSPSMEFGEFPIALGTLGSNDYGPHLAFL